VSLLGAASSVGYYYSVYLPSRDAKLDRERVAERKLAEQARKADQDRLEREREAEGQRRNFERLRVQANYEACIARTEETYNHTWALNCKDVAEKRRKQRAACNLGPATCDSMYPVADPGPNCSLPNAIANSLNVTMGQGKDRCLQESKAGLQ
jgi:hypothetical protein